MKSQSTFYRLLVVIIVTCVVCYCRGQWLTGGTFNEQYLSSGNTGVIVGTTSASPPSALTVRGDQLPTATGEVFRTDCASGTNTHWRLLRGGTEHGHLYSGASGSNFNIQQSINDASLWLRNYTDNGIRLIDDQAFLNNLNGYSGLTHLGYVAIGVESEMNPTSVTRKTLT